MPYFLPSSRETGETEPGINATSATGGGEDMADLKIFWGPEICRLEYLLHLLDTGRIKDEAVRPA
jgi:hypothetical protein